MLQQVRYDPYGVPFGISKADLTADGVLDSADSSLFVALYNSGSGTHPFADWNLDGTLNSQDPIAYLNSYNADVALGYGVLSYASSRAGGANRKAYAGYEIDPVLTGANGRESVYHVRHRVLLAELGRWNRRDPLGYVDGFNLYWALKCQPLATLDPDGRACTVTFSCSLSSSSKVSDCCRNCVYYCVETHRVPSMGGTVDCEDVPPGPLSRTVTQQKCNIWCLLGVPFCHAPGESACASDFTTTVVYSDWGDLPGRDCDRDECIAICNATEEIGLLACDRIGDPTKKAACEAAVRAAAVLCRDFCNIWCKGGSIESTAAITPLEGAAASVPGRASRTGCMTEACGSRTGRTSGTLVRESTVSPGVPLPPTCSPIDSGDTGDVHVQ
ncbi:MAG: hypothetical protein KIS87_04405 [Phycisphaeraceae bacterium]|nr:hypothetical protein [Phycisphaeraceae bacterium]